MNNWSENDFRRLEVQPRIASRSRQVTSIQSNPASVQMITRRDYGNDGSESSIDDGNQERAEMAGYSTSTGTSHLVSTV